MTLSPITNEKGNLKAIKHYYSAQHTQTEQFRMGNALKLQAVSMDSDRFQPQVVMTRAAPQ